MKRSLNILLCIAIGSWWLSVANGYSQPKREFRAAWFTTVWAIDWPTSWGQSTASGAQKQQAELLQMVDSLAAANMNACFFQVRGFCDAMYRSQYEPWSKYLTGTRGGTPSYDPLLVLIEYAHYKGIEVHAWLNPYRYATSEDTYGRLPNDYHNTHPEWLVNCGGITILNPSMPEVKQRIKEVIGDLVNNYDLDGVIFDDYFYQSGYQNSYDDTYYQATGAGMTRADWRRAQVNDMVRMVRDTIKQVKPWVTFGIGPAGVAGSANTSAPVYGVDPCPVGSDWQYNGIYSDPLAWYDQQLIDYMAPQLYWKIGSGTAYERISDWWSYIAGHFNRHCYPSPTLSSLKADNLPVSSTEYHADEIGNQLQLNREFDLLGAPGGCLYSYKSGMKTAGFFRYIRNHVNQHPAVVPMMSWYHTDACKYVENIRRSGSSLQWTAPEANLRYAVYAVPADSVGYPGIFGSSRYLLGTTYMPTFSLPSNVTGTLAVSVLDRFGNEYPVRTIDNTTWGSSAAATLLMPANGASTLLPCTFSWQRAAGADSYFFQLSKNADFSTIDYERETLDTTFFVGNVEWLQSGTPYYWRVRTRSANATDTYSAPFAFTGTHFHMLSPEDGSRDLPRTLTLVCDSVLSASASYLFEVATENTFAASKMVYSATTSQPRLTIPDSVLMPSRLYYARATVTFDGITATSAYVSFRTEAVEVPVPVIISPADGDTIYGSEIEVCWQEQASSGFRVELATAESFAPRVTKTVKTDAFTYCNTYIDLTPGTYYLRVKAVADGGNTDPSETVKVQLEAATALPNMSAGHKVQKLVRDGQILILRDGKQYNLLGAPVE